MLQSLWEGGKVETDARQDIQFQIHLIIRLHRDAILPSYAVQQFKGLLNSKLVLLLSKTFVIH